MSNCITNSISKELSTILSESRDKCFRKKASEHCYVFDINERPVFFKTYNEPALIKLAKQIEIKLILKKLYWQVPALKYRDFSARGEQEKELQTIAAWHSAGIIAPEVLAITTQGVAFRYIHCVTYKILLSQSYNPPMLDQMLETYHAIRRLARSKRRIDLLHSDCHLTNFLYDIENDVAVAIDPSIRFLPNTTFEHADTSLNLFLAFSFFTLQTDFSTQCRYIRQFVNSLDSTERRALIALNEEIPKYVASYFLVRETLLRVVRGREATNILSRYAPNHVHAINRILLSSNHEIGYT